jgi:hypothetical protein
MRIRRGIIGLFTLGLLANAFVPPMLPQEHRTPSELGWDESPVPAGDVLVEVRGENQAADLTITKSIVLAVPKDPQCSAPSPQRRTRHLLAKLIVQDKYQAFRDSLACPW